MRTKLLATTAGLALLLAVPALADTADDERLDAPLGQTEAPAGMADPMIDETAPDDAVADDAATEPPTEQATEAEPTPAEEAPAGMADPMIDETAPDDAVADDAATEPPTEQATEAEPTPAGGVITHAQPGQMKVDDLVGLTVLDAANETVGRIGGLLINEAGTVDGVLVDMGGFLGFGARSVALSWDQVTFVAAEGGNVQLAVVDMLAAELEEAPAFDDEDVALVQ